MNSTRKLSNSPNGTITSTAAYEMDNALTISLELQEWYIELVEECRAIIIEAEFTARWALVEGYWRLGERIRTDAQVEKFAKGNNGFLQQVARNIGIAERTLYYALQAYDKYPDLNRIPEGKTITWKKLITKYLPAPKAGDLPPPPPGVYNVLLADPPWEYSNTGVLGAAEHHYPTMPLEDICTLPQRIHLSIAPNAVLFLWATNPMLADALKVVEAWGFEYKTNLVWVKTELEKPGSGFYVRGRHELLFICTRGSFTPLVDVSPPIGSVIEAPVQEHSRKPEAVYDIIERLYPDQNYIELFARRTRPDWTAWGNEIAGKES